MENKMLKEFTPDEIKSKINVYLNGNLVKPLIATKLYMSINLNEELEGWIDLAAIARDENGEPLKDSFGNIHWICEDEQLEREYNEYNKIAQLQGEAIIPRPKPVIVRRKGLIKWNLVSNEPITT